MAQLTRIALTVVFMSLAQAFVLFLCLQSRLFFAFLVHGISVVVLAFLLIRRHRRHFKRDRWQAVYVYSFFLTAFLPVIGWFSTFLLCGAVVLGLRFFKDSPLEYDVFAPSPVLLPWRVSHRNIERQFKEQVDFEPYVDILNGTDLSRKALVIKKLSQEFSAENVRLLKIALRDTAQEVRIYAAGALVKMESALNERIQIAQENVKKRGGFKSQVDLGDLYRIYAQTGLMEKALADYYWQLAGRAYRSALDIDTKHPEVIVNYGQCLLELGEPAKAKDLLERSLRIWPEHKELLFLNAAVNFHLGEFAHIPLRLKKLDSANLDEQEKEVYSFWCKQP